MSAPQTLSSEQILDKKEALPLLEVSRIQTHGKTSHIRRLGRMSSFIPGDSLSRVPGAEISALCSHLSFSPSEQYGTIANVYDYRVVLMNK